MFHLCDRIDGRSHLSVPLTRSHLYKKADLGTCRDMRPARICFYLPNLPEERHDGFNSWLRLFVGRKLSLVDKKLFNAVGFGCISVEFFEVDPSLINWLHPLWRKRTHWAAFV